MVKTPTKLTFEEYLTYDDGSDTLYTLADGRLVAMPPESTRNILIAEWLFAELLYQRVKPRSLVSTGCWVQVRPLPVQPEDTKSLREERQIENRKPDLTVLSPATLDAMKDRPMCVRLEMPPPRIVVEVVSPGARNRKRDYEVKLEQYRDRAIPEYWLIDPDAETVTVCKLMETEQGKVYEPVVFSGNEAIASDVLPDLTLTVATILSRRER